MMAGEIVKGNLHSALLAVAVLLAGSYTDRTRHLTLKQVLPNCLMVFRRPFSPALLWTSLQSKRTDKPRGKHREPAGEGIH